MWHMMCSFSQEEHMMLLEPIAFIASLRAMVQEAAIMKENYYYAHQVVKKQAWISCYG